VHRYLHNNEEEVKPSFTFLIGIINSKKGNGVGRYVT